MKLTPCIQRVFKSHSYIHTFIQYFFLSLLTNLGCKLNCDFKTIMVSLCQASLDHVCQECQYSTELLLDTMWIWLISDQSIRFMTKGHFFQKVLCIFQFFQKMCRKLTWKWDFESVLFSFKEIKFLKSRY